ncbi:TonB-dependent receptor plug domain-containing protein [Geofilum rubicundum]|uniref:TonB-dependent receptor plug domain-containing protein n=1 Tax=Geofilum rubicundum TaxID=472113 RepID=UPI001D0F006C|nr:TonB-dependent receptor plug domain-containing protein [Geofilum rubicundum]
MPAGRDRHHQNLSVDARCSGGTEGTSGFYVRGGGPDQNLILLDGVPVYNVNHLFGFMSVFNSDAIRNVTLIKGGFPARYGGRLSSVLDIRMKEGNNQEFKGNASIGLISSKLTLEGPIKSDKTSFMFSGRRSYVDLLSYPFQMAANKKYGESENLWVGYFLQDFNAKINHIFNNQHRLYLSVYTGKDKFFMNDKYEYTNTYSSYYGQDGEEGHQVSIQYKSKDKARLQWGNTTGALRWNNIINNQLFANLTATVSDYKFRIFEDYEEERIDLIENTTEKSSYFYEYYSQIRDYGLKADFDFVPSPNHYLRFGMHNTLHYFSPGVTVNKDYYDSGSTPIDTIYGNKNIPANEMMVYVEDDITLSQAIRLNAGLHYSNFHVQGTTYHSLEPRLSARFMLSSRISAKASYTTMQQYLHLLANSSMGLPTDLWVPATKKIKPQKSQQAALGFAYAPNTIYELSVEGYYKYMENLIDYAEGASFFELDQGNWEDLVTSGEGESYGVEFLAQKHQGRFSGWIGYTLSWANRQFDEIGSGEKYPYRYDSRHDISIVTTIKLTEKTDFGAAWVYRTGYPFTMEDEEFQSPFTFFKEPNSLSDNSGTIEHFENRNNYRMPDYHRLDLGFNFHKQKKRVYRTWSVGVYNAYARNNPFMIYKDNVWDEQNNTSTTQLRQLSIFNLIPYVRWGIKF